MTDETFDRPDEATATTTMRLLRRRAMRLMAVGLIAASAGATAQAQKFPDRQVTFVVPYAAGGVTDLYARTLAKKLAEMWGQPVVVENKPGGGTVIGTQVVSNAPPTGHSLLLTSYGFTANPVLMSKLPYDPATLAPVMLLGTASNMLVLGASSPLKSLPDVIRHARSAPGALKLASSGNASSPHIAAEMFARAVGAEITHLAYKGTAPAMTDVLGSQVDGIFDGVSAMPNIRAGKLRAIAFASDTRHPLAPEVPTFRELGIDFIFGSWFGFFVPAGTPAAIQAQLNRDLLKALEDQAVRAALEKTGLELRGASPQAFAQFLKGESDKLRALVAAGARISID